MRRKIKPWQDVFSTATIYYVLQILYILNERNPKLKYLGNANGVPASFIC